jgi:hypothetical protein
LLACLDAGFVDRSESGFVGVRGLTDLPMALSGELQAGTSPERNASQAAEA